MPKSGRFVCVWEYEGEIQSSTFLRKEGEERLMDINDTEEDREFNTHMDSDCFLGESTIYVVLE